LNSPGPVESSPNSHSGDKRIVGSRLTFAYKLRPRENAYCTISKVHKPSIAIAGLGTRLSKIGEKNERPVVS
jgi:hypothetical protein